MSENNKKGLFGGKSLIAAKKIKSPDKDFVNLIQDNSKEERENNIAVILIALLFTIIFIKFGIIDQIARINAAKAAYELKELEVQQAIERNKEFATVKIEYDKLTDWYMTEEEKAEINKINVFGMLEDDLFGFTGIDTIQTTGNSVNIKTEVTNLQVISNFLTKLQADSRNGYVTISNATASNGKNETKNDVVTTILITYTDGEGPGAKNENPEVHVEGEDALRDLNEEETEELNAEAMANSESSQDEGGTVSAMDISQENSDSQENKTQENKNSEGSGN